MAKKVDLELFRRRVPAQVKLMLLALLACILLVVDAHTRVLEPLRKGFSVALYPFQRMVMLPRDALVVVQDYSNAAQVLKDESESLQQQRIELSQVIGNAAQLASENRQLRRLLGVVEDKPINSAVVVEVLYEPATNYRHRLVFDKGTRQGIEPGMPVIDEGGIVGQVIRVTPFSAEAALLTDEKSAVPVQLLRNGLRLIAFGSSMPGKIEVRYFSPDADIEEGDVLVTSGIGGSFPAGISVGIVEWVERDAASGFARALAQPTSHPDRYRHFLILKQPVAINGANQAPDPASTPLGETIAPVTTN